MTRAKDDETTEFLNVDLEVFSRESLAGFGTSLGRSVHVLHEGRWGRRYASCMELWASGYGQSTDSIMRRMTRLLDKMSPKAKRLWSRAQVRQLNVGIQAAHKPRGFELVVSAETLRSMAKLGAQIVVTVYGAEAS